MKCRCSRLTKRFNGCAAERNVARISDIPEFDAHIVPSAEPPTGMGEPGLPPLAPAFANTVPRLTGKPLRQLPSNIENKS
jgi:isoquinoline 1-oxidoreductase subunit beta